jgi:hypothetical protein
MDHSLPAWAATAADVGLLFGVGLLLNVPFGWLRAGARRLSPTWFLYVHLSIPLLFLLRHLLGLSLWAIPFSLAGAVLGQVCGGRLRSRRAGCACCPPLPSPERP